MVMLTDLATALRAAGLEVVEVPGWQSRGHGHMYSVETIVCHHTATASSAAGDYPSLGIVRDGRPDLSGPLAQLGLARSGAVYVIAAGVSYHAGEVWSTWMDNWHAIGIEAEHDGISPWPAAQVDAYARLVAALRAHYDIPLARVLGHKEVCQPAGRKTDPNFDMDTFRARVADIAQEDDMANYADQLDRIEAAAKAAATAATAAEQAADRARAGSYKRDKKLIELARATTDDVDALVAKVDKA